MAEPAVDLAQFLSPINIVAVLRSIAVGGGPGDCLDELRALDSEQLVIFRAELGKARG
jgi:hypothetical protein